MKTTAQSMDARIVSGKYSFKEAISKIKKAKGVFVYCHAVERNVRVYKYDLINEMKDADGSVQIRFMDGEWSGWITIDNYS